METKTQINETKHSFSVLFFAIFIDLLGFGIIIPILPFLVQEINPNREGELLAYILAAYSLTQFVVAPFWGRISDKIGRRPVILIGVFGSSIGFALFGLVHTYPLYLLSRIIAGFFTGASLPTARAYIADITPPKERARRFGLLGAAFGIGFTFGPAIGSLLSLKIFLIPGLPSQATASLFAALLSLINFYLAYKRLLETLHYTKNEEMSLQPKSSIATLVEFFKFKGIVILLIIFGITTLVFSGFETTFALFANFVDNRITQDNIGYFFGLIGILIAVFQSSLVGPTVDRLGEELTLVVGLIFEVLGLFLLSLSSSIFLLILFVIPMGFGEALVTPTVNSAISNRIPENQQGGGLGINSSIGSLGRVIGPLYGGVLYDKISPPAPLFVGSLIILVLAIFGYILLKPTMPKSTSAPMS